MLGPLEKVWGAVEGSTNGPVYVCGSEHTCMNVYVRVNARVRARAALVYVCVRVCERLCRFVSESGDVTTGASLWPLPAQLDWPSYWSESGRYPSALRLLHSGQSTFRSFHPDSNLSVTPRALFLQKDLPCSQILPQCTARFQGGGPWGAWRGKAVTGWTVAF